MIRYFLSLFFFLNFFFVRAQEVSMQTTSGSTVPNDYELTDIQYSSWKKILNNWIGSDFQNIEAENKVALNGKSCSSFYREIKIKIGANGKLKYYKMIEGKKCRMAITKP